MIIAATGAPTVLKVVYLLLLLSLFSNVYAQQTIPLINPSLEGPPAVGEVPLPWYTLTPSPDTEPNYRNFNPIQASDGATYARMAWIRDGSEGAEEMACELSQQLDSGRTYMLSFDLAMETKYIQPPDFGSLRIRGSSKRSEIGETLWKSGAFYHKTWKRYTAILKPEKNYHFISFGPYNVEEDPYKVAITYIDNFSAIIETIILDVTVVNACPGESNGAVAVTIPYPSDSYTYSWLPGGYTTSKVKGLPIGTYMVTVKSARGVTVSKTVEITNTDVRVTANVKNLNCYGDTGAYLDVAVTGGQEPYKYFLNDDPDGQEDHIFRNITPGNYMITVSDAQGCTRSENILVKEPLLFQLKDISIKTTSCSSATNGQIILTPAGGTPPYTYSIPPYISQPDSIFRQLNAGIYHYLISDNNNCTLEGDAEIKREWRDCAVFVPNAFSPNRDGLNELFRPKIQDDISEYRMAVYGRWGQLIFESNNPEQGWDGKLQGTDVPSGNYIWVITYKDHTKQPIQQQGSVLLTR